MPIYYLNEGEEGGRGNSWTEVIRHESVIAAFSSTSRSIFSVDATATLNDCQVITINVCQPIH